MTRLVAFRGERYWLIGGTLVLPHHCDIEGNPTLEALLAPEESFAHIFGSEILRFGEVIGTSDELIDVIAGAPTARIKMADAFNLPLRCEPEEGMLPTQIWGAAGGAVAATSKNVHAEAIVQAVNAHDDLIEALRQLITLHDRPHGFDDGHWYGDAVEIARAVLIKATSS